MSSVAEILKCPICLDTMKQPPWTTEGCGHTFHKKCIFKWIKGPNDNCPTCKQKITSIFRSVVLDQLIAFHFPTTESDGDQDRSLSLRQIRRINQERTTQPPRRVPLRQPLRPPSHPITAADFDFLKNPSHPELFG